MVKLGTLFSQGTHEPARFHVEVQMLLHFVAEEVLDGLGFKGKLTKFEWYHI